LAQDPSPQKTPAGTLGVSAVDAQLARILASTEFRKSIRMCRFLRLVTSETLEGNSATLKEYKIGTEVFDKDDSFDPRVDPIVRNEARRLRRKLELYYLTEGKSDRLLIQLPRGGYIPVFEVRENAHQPVVVATARKWRRLALSCAVLSLLVLGWRLLMGPTRFSPGPARGNGSSVPNRPQPMGPSAEACSLGRYLLFRLRAEDIRASRAQLEQAVRLDPSFAEALGLLALNYQVSSAFGLVSREEGIAKSRELAVRSTALDPDSAAAELALAVHSSLLEEDYATGERHFQQILARNPDDAAARSCYAVGCLLPLGRVAEARREARTANELSPSGLSAYALALTDYCGRDYQSHYACA
jgi:hypothetical protein